MRCMGPRLPAFASHDQMLPATLAQGVGAFGDKSPQPFVGTAKCEILFHRPCGSTPVCFSRPDGFPLVSLISITLIPGLLQLRSCARRHGTEALKHGGRARTWKTRNPRAG